MIFIPKSIEELLGLLQQVAELHDHLPFVLLHVRHAYHGGPLRADAAMAVARAAVGVVVVVVVHVGGCCRWCRLCGLRAGGGGCGGGGGHRDDAHNTNEGRAATHYHHHHQHSLTPRGHLRPVAIGERARSAPRHRELRWRVYARRRRRKIEAARTSPDIMAEVSAAALLTSFITAHGLRVRFVASRARPNTNTSTHVFTHTLADTERNYTLCGFRVSAKLI